MFAVAYLSKIFEKTCEQNENATQSSDGDAAVEVRAQP
jgi:hypothetical protein